MYAAIQQRHSQFSVIIRLTLLITRVLHGSNFSALSLQIWCDWHGLNRQEFHIEFIIIKIKIDNWEYKTLVRWRSPAYHYEWKISGNFDWNFGGCLFNWFPSWISLRHFWPNPPRKVCLPRTCGQPDPCTSLLITMFSAYIFFLCLYILSLLIYSFSAIYSWTLYCSCATSNSYMPAIRIVNCRSVCNLHS